MDSITALAEKLVKFPGVGPRQAKRLVYFLLSRGPAEIEAFVQALQALKENARQCTQCFRFFPAPTKGLSSMGTASGTTKSDFCSECSDRGRDRTLMLVVERDPDLDAMRKSGTFNGRFFVLGGSLPVLETDPSKKIRIRELLTEVDRAVREDSLHEIILATSANEEGEHTGLYVTKTLEPLAKKHSFTVTMLGRGLSTGAELEYADSETLKNALRNRS